MSRFKINEDTLAVIDRFKSNADLIYYMSDEILLDIAILKEMVLGEASKICSNKEFKFNSLKELHTIRLSNVTYVINSDVYDPSLVKFLGARALNKASIPRKILETIKL